MAWALNNLAMALEGRGDTAGAWRALARSLDITERYVVSQFASASPRDRLSFTRRIRYRLDNLLSLTPLPHETGYGYLLRLRGIVARSEAAERLLARGAGPELQSGLAELKAAQRVAAGLANARPDLAASEEERAAWQRRYAEATARRERLTVDLSGRLGALREALERLDLGVENVQRSLRVDTVLVEMLRVWDGYLAWVVRHEGEVERLDLGEAERIEAASVRFLAAIANEDSREPETTTEREAAGAALRSLVWEPIRAKLGDGVRRVVLVPDMALAAVPFAALPGQAPGTYLGDELVLSYVTNAQDLVPWPDAAPTGQGALVVGGVDYERAVAVGREAVARAPPERLAAPDRAPRGGHFLALPQTRGEAEELAARLGEGTTLLLGDQATEARVREEVKGRRFVHVATHGFAREDLLQGLNERHVKASWLSADEERQLAAGHDPMLLSGVALAGANPRKGGGGDDGILTALEASYLDLDGVQLVTLSACDTARGTPESGEGVQGLVQALQMAGARNVLASLWPVDDEATRRLMEGLYERLLRTEQALPPAEALREAARELRETTDEAGRRRFALPRTWAAFVAYGAGR
jgi:CHAT domain-containing protein